MVSGVVVVISRLLHNPYNYLFIYSLSPGYAAYDAGNYSPRLLKFNDVEEVIFYFY